jgi:hypothetical protein
MPRLFSETDIIGDPIFIVVITTDEQEWLDYMRLVYVHLSRKRTRFAMSLMRTIGKERFDEILTYDILEKIELVRSLRDKENCSAKRCKRT